MSTESASKNCNKGENLKSFEHSLEKSDLFVDAIYRGGRKGNAGDDPFPRLLSVSNMGGFRYRGTWPNLSMIVLTTTMSDPDWPDSFDAETGIITYYGDNKKSGTPLHGTPRRGNDILKMLFELASGGPESRRNVPPIFVFTNAGTWRDVRFLGLAVPGTIDERFSEDLVAVWKFSKGKRFQNYRARFTILDAPKVTRAWISDIIAGTNPTRYAPPSWTAWIAGGAARPLMAARSVEYRNKAEQLPSNPSELALITILHEYFSGRPHDFEFCAASIVRLMLPEIAYLDVTRPARDGGRDAIGRLRVGSGPSSILVDFAIEAKCYKMTNSVGVRELSRLISRLRHRQFGVLVTTSYLDLQAYKELKDDAQARHLLFKKRWKLSHC